MVKAIPAILRLILQVYLSLGVPNYIKRIIKKEVGFIQLIKFPQSVRVISSIMGSGKTSYIIDEINNSPEQKRIILVKYLSEANWIVEQCQAAQITTPSEIPFSSKQAHFYALLGEGRSIVTTHELFCRLPDSEAQIRRIRECGYKLIFDEVTKVIEPLNVSKHDEKEILERYVEVDDTGRVTWTAREYTGNHTEIKNKMIVKQLFVTIKARIFGFYQLNCFGLLVTSLFLHFCSKVRI